MNSLTPFLILGVCYFSCFWLFFGVWKINSGNVTSVTVQKGYWSALHLRHIGGVILMVIVPVQFLPELPQNYLGWPDDLNPIQVIMLLITGLVLMRIAVKEVDQADNKKIQPAHRSTCQILLYMVLRNFFLAGYEWFFRGCILFTCISIMGVGVALFINVILYAFIHVFNGKKELLGAIPLGIILCLFTLWWQSVWPAVFLHIILSSTYESMILYRFYWKRLKPVL
jgi:membrane protease YdiL (CAAX protease family)